MKKLAFSLLAIGLFAGASATAGLADRGDTCDALIVSRMIFDHGC
ncbi:hypothetical protein [Falsirhodobacter sp. 20TX0035]|nr:hypothetical protein [Falsirhodobacter sp. 20TX0035]MDB6453562.1 hypothetical protein [Falsirhodobacter sp. 20TX0035]